MRISEAKLVLMLEENPGDRNVALLVAEVRRLRRAIAESPTELIDELEAITAERPEA